MKRKPPFEEGDLFAVPLRCSGFAVGLLVRQPKGAAGALGFFFGPRRETVPAPSELEGIRPGDAIARILFYQSPWIKDSWPRIGRLQQWARESWQMPEIVRETWLSDAAGEEETVYYRITYANDEPGYSKSETYLGTEKPSNAIIEAFSGTGALQYELSELLCPDDTWRAAADAEIERDMEAIKSSGGMHKKHRKSFKQSRR